MTERPWETESDQLDFVADGLSCAMRRGGYDAWCGYVGIGEDHPLFGLPTNHPLKLPRAWFEGRNARQGYGPMDLMMHAMSGAESIEDACPVSLAFEVHGGLNYADDHVPGRKPDRLWWFGFDCGHAGDYLPTKGETIGKLMEEMVDSMPPEVRGTMRKIVREHAARPRDYRDQQYVVSECQSLAAQLNAIVEVITKESVNGGADHRRD